jgi:hypothetical protein
MKNAFYNDSHPTTENIIMTILSSIVKYWFLIKKFYQYPGFQIYHDFFRGITFLSRLSFVNSFSLFERPP